MTKKTEEKALTNYQRSISLIDKIKPQMMLALPKHMDADRMARIALTELRQTPLLQECEPASFVKCLMVSAQLGLEPGLLGHAYFVPYKKHKDRRPDGQPKVEANLIIGYKGMIELARRSGQIQSIEARVICENDDYEVCFGLDSNIKHNIKFGADRGKPIAYYAIAKLIGGGVQFEVMSLDEVMKVRDQSKAKEYSPWGTHFDEMAKKTVIRRLFKYLPVSVELQQAVTMDEYADIGKQAETMDYFEVDQETGEILNHPDSEEKEPEKEESQADDLANKLG